MMCSVVIVVAVIVVAAAAQLFWKPAELNVGPCISLTLTLHAHCLTLTIRLWEGTMVSLVRIKQLKVKASSLSSSKLLLLSERAHQWAKCFSHYVFQQFCKQQCWDFPWSGNRRQNKEETLWNTLSNVWIPVRNNPNVSTRILSVEDHPLAIFYRCLCFL